MTEYITLPLIKIMNQFNTMLHQQSCAVRRTSKENFFQELGFESLQKTRWFRNLCFLKADSQVG